MRQVSQAIETKYLGLTPHKGARITASCAAGKRYTNWDDCLSIEENHVLAASLHAVSLGWMDLTVTDGKVFRPQLVTGVLKNGNYVHVTSYTEVKNEPESE